MRVSEAFWMLLSIILTFVTQFDALKLLLLTVFYFSLMATGGMCNSEHVSLQFCHFSCFSKVACRYLKLHHFSEAYIEL